MKSDSINQGSGWPPMREISPDMSISLPGVPRGRRSHSWHDDRWKYVLIVILEDSYSRHFAVDDEECKLELLDTSGNDFYANLYEKVIIAIVIRT